jgi:hypothetical protein
MSWRGVPRPLGTGIAGRRRNARVARTEHPPPAEPARAVVGGEGGGSVASQIGAWPKGAVLVLSVAAWGSLLAGWLRPGSA